MFRKISISAVSGFNKLHLWAKTSLATEYSLTLHCWGRCWKITANNIRQYRVHSFILFPKIKRITVQWFQISFPVQIQFKFNVLSWLTREAKESPHFLGDGDFSISSIRIFSLLIGSRMSDLIHEWILETNSSRFVTNWSLNHGSR